MANGFFDHWAVFLSDTMRAKSEVAELKQSRSRTDAGIVTFAHRLVNQRDEIACRCLRMALFKKARSAMSRPSFGSIRSTAV